MQREFCMSPAQSSSSVAGELPGVRTLLPGHLVREFSRLDPLPHVYKLPIDAGFSARLVINQRDSDLFVEVADSDGAPVRYDERERGPEFITLFTPVPGTYSLAIGAVSRTWSGAYNISVELSPGKDAAHDLRVAAETSSTEGKRLAALHDSGASQEALRHHEQALEFWRQLGEVEAEAAALLAIGEIHYFQSRFETAKEYFSKSGLLYLCNRDRRGLAEARNGIGVSLWQLGRIEEAMLTLDSALQDWRAVQHAPGEAATLSNLGTLSYEVGEWQQALDHFSAARHMARSLKDRSGEGFACNNLAVAHNALGQHRRALSYLKLALRLFARAGNTLAAAKALLLLGRIHFFLDDLALAQNYGRMALDQLSALGDDRARGDALRHLAQIAEKAGNLTQAVNLYSQALDIYRSIGNQQGEGAALHGLGSAYFNLAQYDQALRFLVHARHLRKQIGAANVEAETIFLVARLAYDRGRLTASRRHAEAAIDIAEQLRNRLSSSDLRTSYLSSKHDYYGIYVQLLMRLHEEQPGRELHIRAFEASERSRARGLLDLLQQFGQSPIEGVSAELRDAECRLEQRIRLWSYRRARALAAGDRRQAERAEQQLTPLLDNYQDLNSQIRTVNPSALTLVALPLLSLDEVQKNVLDEHTMLLHYAFGNERCYLWVVGKQTFHSFDLGPKEAVIEAARAVYDRLTSAANESRRPENVAKCDDALAKLSALVLPSDIFSPEVTRLVIAPDGVLQYIPFAALMNSQRPVLLDHEVTYVPSISALASLRTAAANRTAPRKTLALVADPVFDARDPRVPQKQEGSKRTQSHFNGTRGTRRLSRLPFSRVEAEHLLNLVPADQVWKALGFDANETSIDSETIGSCRIVHFASHALIDDQRPELSTLVVSLVNPDGTPQDGLIGLDRIFRLRLSADLVVLSACQTGLGRDVRGEGMVGIARGFMFAGASRLLVSLWKVDDEATSELMRHFYESMLGPRQLTPASALAVAQRAMLDHKRWKSPYYWAGFVLQGEWR